MRYARQIKLEEVGMKGQKSISEGTILVVGAGGLGSPILLYLVSAGIGKVKIIDGDSVALSNLQRQILFQEKDVGKNKASAAKANLKALNSTIEIEAIPKYINQENISDLLHGVDCVLDGSDNFSTKYLVNDACVYHGIPLVQGSIHQWEGQIGVYPRIEKGELRDVYPEPPLDEPPTCEEEGVLGPVAGIIGSMMASEGMKLVLKLSSVCSYSTYNGLTNAWSSLGFEPIERDKLNYNEQDYDFYCPTEIDEWMVLESEIEKGELYQCIDVRENFELVEKKSKTWYIPIADLSSAEIDKKLKDKIPVFLCGKGQRSKAAALWYRTETNKKSYYLKEEL